MHLVGIVPLLMANKSYFPLLYGLKIANAINVGMWQDCKYILKQVNGIGHHYAQQLHSIGIKSFEHLQECEPGKIELVINDNKATGRNPPFGVNLVKKVEGIKLPTMGIVKLKSGPTHYEYRIEVGLKKPSVGSPNDRANFHLLIGSSTGKLIKSSKLSLQHLVKKTSFSIKYKPTLSNESIKFSLLSNDYVGIDFEQEVHLGNTVRLMATKSSSGGSKYFEDQLWGGIDDQTLFEMCDQQQGIFNPTLPKINSTIPATAVGKRAKLTKLKLPLNNQDQNFAAIIPQLKANNQDSECKHPCQDKASCRHLCCKIGVRQPRSNSSKLAGKTVEKQEKPLKKKLKFQNITSNSIHEPLDEIAIATNYLGENAAQMENSTFSPGTNLPDNGLDAADKFESCQSYQVVNTKSPNAEEEIGSDFDQLDASSASGRIKIGCSDDYTTFDNDLNSFVEFEEDNLDMLTKRHSSITFEKGSECILPSNVVQVVCSSSNSSDLSSQSTHEETPPSPDKNLNDQDIDALKSILADFAS